MHENQVGYTTGIVAGSGVYGDTTNYPIAKTIRPEAESPRALGELSRAAAEYAKAAESFITARHALNDAKDEWQRCQQLVGALMEKEGI